MPTVVGVSFRPVTKVYYFDPGAMLDLQAGDYVIVETSQGQEVGQVVWPARQLADSDISGELKPVIRRATAADLVERDQFRSREDEALRLCRTKTLEHHLPMKVVGAEYSFDGSRLTVSFTAEGRVDFRDLVRDLSRTFATRIEMKQIGVRDQAKALDGVGKCGRQLCCSSWLREFNPVTIKMAKQQNLPLNPPEISGVCGRLLCCLAYEEEAYAEARKALPKVGAVVMTPDGEGKVRRVQPLQEILAVRLEDGITRDYPASELGMQPAKSPARSCCGGCALRSSTGQVSLSPPAITPSPPPSADDHADSRARPQAKRRLR